MDYPSSQTLFLSTPVTTTKTSHIRSHPFKRPPHGSIHSIVSSQVTKTSMSEHEIQTITTNTMTVATQDGSMDYSSVKQTKTAITAESLEDQLQRNAFHLVPAWDRVRETEKALAYHEATPPRPEAPRDEVSKWVDQGKRLAKRLEGLRNYRDCLGTQRANVLKKLENLTGDYKRGRWVQGVQDHGAPAAEAGRVAGEHDTGEAHQSRLESNTRHALMMAGPGRARGDESEVDLPAHHGSNMPPARDRGSSRGSRRRTYSNHRGAGRRRGAGRGSGAEGVAEMSAGYDSTDTEWRGSSASGGVSLW